MKQLTSGNWLVQDVLGFDEKKKEIIFTATKESPLQSNLYKVNVNNGKITPLDNGKGVHRGTLSAGAAASSTPGPAPKCRVASTSCPLKTAKASTC